MNFYLIPDKSMHRQLQFNSVFWQNKSSRIFKDENCNLMTNILKYALDLNLGKTIKQSTLSLDGY